MPSHRHGDKARVLLRRRRLRVVRTTGECIQRGVIYEVTVYR